MLEISNSYAKATLKDIQKKRAAFYNCTIKIDFTTKEEGVRRGGGYIYIFLYYILISATNVILMEFLALK